MNEPEPGPAFRRGVQAGGFVFVSGQASVDQDGTFIPGTFAEQMERSIQNLRRVLADFGLSLGDVVKVNAFVHREIDAAEYNRLYPNYFTEPRPARTTLLNGLTEELLFEIEAIAYAAR